MKQSKSIGDRLEKYTLKRPQEILIITAEINGEQDQVAIFKGFSSSLMHPTAFDPDIPVLPANAQILSVDRAKSPYNPKQPVYIQQGLTAAALESLLAEVGV